MNSRRIAWLAALSFLAASGCDGGGGGPQDAGLDADGGGGGDGVRLCLTELDCSAGEVCAQHLCQPPGPPADRNRVLGRFTALVNASNHPDNQAEVRGKLEGDSFYMEWVTARVPDVGDIQLDLKSILTNDLWINLVLTVPRQTPLDTPLYFGPNAVVSGVYMRLKVDGNGRVIEQTPLATVVGGQIDFSSFGTANLSRVEGSFNLELRLFPISP
jgi:hypothetical protein